MNTPVEVSLMGRKLTVLDDELNNLIHQGLVSYKSAISALENEGIALDKRFYPWLRDVENWATGEFDLDGPAKEEAKPEVLSEDAHAAVELHDEATQTADVNISADKVSVEAPHVDVEEDAHKDEHDNSEGAE
jgi:hypothetical protein